MQRGAGSRSGRDQLDEIARLDEKQDGPRAQAEPPIRRPARLAIKIRAAYRTTIQPTKATRSSIAALTASGRVDSPMPPHPISPLSPATRRIRSASEAIAISSAPKSSAFGNARHHGGRRPLRTYGDGGDEQKERRGEREQMSDKAILDRWQLVPSISIQHFG